jgi:hypothetical protein
MQVIYHELLPDSYLLIPAAGLAKEPTAALLYCLNHARRSGKSAVWIDCRLLDSQPAENARLLQACRQRLRELHLHLLLFNVAEALHQELLRQHAVPRQCIVPTLNDAFSLSHAA